MVLFESTLLVPNYDTATDILSVDWPDLGEFLLPELEKEVTALINAISHYDIKKLMVDTSKATIQVNDAQYQEFLNTFATRLTETRLQKFARILTASPEKEAVIHAAKESSLISEKIDCRSFRTESEAMEWLMA